MKKVIFSLLLLALAGAAFAQDSGLYYNPARDGEGLSLQRSGDTVVAFLFTYGGEESETPAPIAPWLSPQVPLEDPLNGQRWFFTGAGTLVDNSYAEGILYSTGGVNYPVPLQPNPVAKPVAVGEYVLSRYENGWELLVSPLKNGPLLEDDPLFTVHFVFGVRLLKAGD